jgi:hypothetical protein
MTSNSTDTESGAPKGPRVLSWRFALVGALLSGLFWGAVVRAPTVAVLSFLMPLTWVLLRPRRPWPRNSWLIATLACGAVFAALSLALRHLTGAP